MIDPNDYWVNNPLITPVNKALMYDNDISGAVSHERERIIALLEDDRRECKPACRCRYCASTARNITLIKGEVND